LSTGKLGPRMAAMTAFSSTLPWAHDVAENVAVINGTFLQLRSDTEAKCSGRPRFHSDSDLYVSSLCDSDLDEAMYSATVKHDGESTIAESFDESLSDNSDATIEVLSDSDSEAKALRWAETDDEADEPDTHIVPRIVFIPAWASQTWQPDRHVEGSCKSKRHARQPSQRQRTLTAKFLESTEEADSHLQTTVMLKNLPNNLLRDSLVQLLDDAGFNGAYDFLYLPIDFAKDANLGYAFLNLVDGDTATEFWSAFQGFSNWGEDRASSKVCQLEWSQLQGFKAHVQRYRNSPVMHAAMCDSRRPLLFVAGKRTPFPPPTCRIPAPRRRGRYAQEHRLRRA